MGEDRWFEWCYNLWAEEIFQYGAYYVQTRVLALFGPHQYTVN